MNQGMNLEITKDIANSQHFHSELEILFVVEGQISVSIKDISRDLRKEDVLVINSGVLHEIRCPDHAIVCIARYDYALIAEVLDGRSAVFLCDSSAQKEKDFHKIRETFHDLIYQYIRQSHKTYCRQNSLMFLLLDLIIEDFQMPDSMVAVQEYGNDVRLQQIFQYVSGHFRTGINLSELAASLYVSKSTLSRLFKKQTGMYFADYVNQIKCRYATHDLLYTDKSITKLAVDCGFSNPSAFNKVFRELYGMTPSEYRKSRAGMDREQDKEQEQTKQLCMELREKEKELNPSFQQGSLISVTADVRQTTPLHKIWNRVINMGSVYNLTMANVQYHTLYLAEHLGFQYVRLWSVFSERLMITDGIHIGNYNYDKLDSVLDFLVEYHIYPFLDFGRRPDTILRAENAPVFYGAEYVEFHSRRAWEALFEDFIRHLMKRYGKEEVSHWIFEITYDPIHVTESQYYQSDDYDPLDVYEHAIKTIKQYCPDASVGGPGAIVNWRVDFLQTFLSEVKKRDVIPDFISFLLFPYETRTETGEIHNYQVVQESYEYDSVCRMKEILAQAELDGCKLYITEMNPTLSNRNYLNDSCFRGVYLVKKISELCDMADLIGTWTGSDWISSYYDTRSIANGGNGLLTKDSIRKPAYFALRFLTDLGNELIEKGSHYIITRKGQSFYILCYNFKWYSASYYVNAGKTDSPEAIADVFENRNPVKLEIVLRYMQENVKYIIKTRTINEQCGSILNEWEKFQYDEHLTAMDVKYIRDCCFPRMMMERQTAVQGKITLQRTLLPHEITVIHIYEAE